MKQKILWLLVGIPGAGKSTWLRQNAKGPVISRDAVRFSIISENEEYFSKEKIVFREFIRQIQEQLDNPNVSDVYVDATHINETSREKVLRQLRLDDAEIGAIVFDVPLTLALYQNSLRSGRACVPQTAIEDMYKKFRNPAFDKRGYDHIIEIGVAF